MCVCPHDFHHYSLRQKEKHFMETAVQSSNEYRNLPVAQLQESTTNPRRRFDEHSLAELAASVPRHISGLLCRWRFCGRGRQTGAQELVVPAPKGT
jgi:hypothetical protein